MEADKTVSTQLEVSEITTAFQTQIVPMPICRYEILNGGPSGELLQYAVIGQQVYHKWTCDSETVNTFCAVVHSCFVDDGNGDKVKILNEEGCALDKYLLNNLEYPTDLMAGQEAHVYKYADRSQLFYQCQIRITIKEPGAECERPKCTDPQGFGAVKETGEKSPIRPTAALRLLKKRAADYDNTMDVRTGINTIDITDQPMPEELTLHFLRYNGLISDGVCVSPSGFIALLGIALLIVAIGLFLFTRSPSSKL
ncbi:Cuticlin-1 [Toxocara canis]|uniref:Cuticlin-1 n=1 Tax=Toxocara canis TaxID=6265 RepID=A0A0B2VUC9_TOXCA|nr:Cuticlin-1 [Toxocara canis]